MMMYVLVGLTSPACIQSFESEDIEIPSHAWVLVIVLFKREYQFEPKSDCGCSLFSRNNPCPRARRTCFGITGVKLPTGGLTQTNNEGIGLINNEYFGSTPYIEPQHVVYVQYLYNKVKYRAWILSKESVKPHSTWVVLQQVSRA